MASKRRHRRRTCTVKVAHETIEAAKIARSMTWSPNQFNIVNVYKCKYCKKYHVGRAPANVKPRRC